jgi:uncharacterized Zn finger protein (UPF0148 family)
MSAKYECPECKRPLLSRRNKKCQYCGVELPEELLYTKAEIEAQDREWKEAERRREAHEKEHEDKERKKRDEGGDAAAVIITTMM